MLAWLRKMCCMVSEAAYCVCCMVSEATTLCLRGIGSCLLFFVAWYRKLLTVFVAHQHSLPQLLLASNISMLQVCSDTTTTHFLLLHTCCTSTMLGYNQLNLSAAHRHSLPQLPLASNISLLQVCSDTTTTQFLLPHTCCLATTNFNDRLQTTFDTPRLIKITAHGSNKHRSLVTTVKRPLMPSHNTWLRVTAAQLTLMTSSMISALEARSPHQCCP